MNNYDADVFFMIMIAWVIGIISIHSNKKIIETLVLRIMMTLMVVVIMNLIVRVMMMMMILMIPIMMVLIAINMMMKVKWY